MAALALGIAAAVGPLSTAVVRVGEARRPGPPPEPPGDGTASETAPSGGMCPSMHARPKQRRGLLLQSGNTTGWGAAREWLGIGGSDVRLVQEHRRRHVEDVAAASDAALKEGWKSLWSPAIGSGTEADEAAGGTAVYVRSHIGLLHAPGDTTASVVDGHVAAGLIEAGGTDGLVAYSLYLEQGGDLSERNWAILTRLAAHIAGHGRQWVIGGDWNLEPHTLQASGWLRKVGGTLVAPPVSSTVRKGRQQGRLIDFWVVSNAPPTR